VTEEGLVFSRSTEDIPLVTLYCRTTSMACRTAERHDYGVDITLEFTGSDFEKARKRLVTGVVTRGPGAWGRPSFFPLLPLLAGCAWLFRLGSFEWATWLKPSITFISLSFVTERCPNCRRKHVPAFSMVVIR
jgi:hypothetical protein